MKGFQKKLLAGVLSLAMVLSAGVLPSQSASAAKKIKLSSSKVTVKVGASKKITVKNAPKKAKVTWSSKNKKIAKVNSSGKITGVKKGNTEVTAKVTYTQKKKKKTTKLTCKVTVNAKKDADDAEESAAPTGAPAASQPAATPTATPEITPEPTPVTLPSFNAPNEDGPSNIGEAREVEIVGGTSDSMTVYDNGSMRPELSSKELIVAEMGQGINLGNTMEATKAMGEIDNFSEATDFEQAWGAPITTQEFIDAVHSYGFNTLRIPVAWSSMVSKDGNYTINEKMLGRVEEIANYALNNGMYVIINIHWDYGWWGQFGACKLDENGGKVADQTTRDNAMKRYVSYWEQISERFKDYSDHLIFESANEEFGPRGDAMNNPLGEDGYPLKVEEGGIAGNLTDEEAYALANQLNQTFLDIVRASGGNNLVRHVLLAGISTNIDMTVDDKYVMPKDIVTTDEKANGASKLSVSVHYYDPWSYCGDGMSSSSYTEKDKKNHTEQFDKMKKFSDAGYGVMVGEYGVCNPRQEQVVDWLADANAAMTERGFLPVLWDTPGTYFERGDCKMKYKDVAEFFNELTGSEGDTDIKESTGKPKTNSEILNVPEEKEPLWSWTGRWRKNAADNIGLDGEKVTSTDMSRFVQTQACTDDSKITFNDWGYQSFLKADLFLNLKKPFIYFTFEEDLATVVGNLELSTSGDDLKGSHNLEKYPYDYWNGRGVALSKELLEGLEEDGWLNLTFGTKPIVTGIYVYDLGE